MAGPAFADVPDRYDVVFSLNDGSFYGFLLADSVESNLPFRTHKALYSYSPTFLERQNVSTQYGDNFQDFFLTGAQADFSEGEGQKFFRVNDVDSVRKYWAGQNVDPVTVPGDVTLTTKTVSTGQSGISLVAGNSSVGPLGLSSIPWLMADTTNLYSVSNAGAPFSIGAHGAGGSVAGLVTDQTNAYIAGSTRITKYDGTSFTSFSTTTLVSDMLYVNNILYGFKPSVDSLLSFDASGNPTTQFQWKNADGGINQGGFIHMVAYGGNIYILRRSYRGTELWTYDGSGCRKLADFAPDFIGTSICVNAGVVYVGGYQVKINASLCYPQVYYYVNGSVGKLWDSATRSFSGTSTTVPMDAFGDGIVFYDPTTGNLLQSSLSLGGVHTIGTMASAPTKIVSANETSGFLAYVDFFTAQTIYGVSANYNSTGYVQTSQYDFDNTLTKIYRGLKVDADIPANTSVDIAYQLDGTGGSYTTLQTGVTSGQEYLLPNNTTGHSISIKVTLNSATGSATPTLRRVYVRAAPTLQQFRRREFLFDLSGGIRDEAGMTSRKNRDGTVYPTDPVTAAKNLRKIATQVVPFTVQDRFDQFTCLADLQQNQEGYDGFAIYEVRPNVFIGRINLREV